MSAHTQQKWGRRVSVGEYQRGDLVAEKFARARGYKNANTAHTRLERLPEEICDAIKAYLDQPGRFARWWAPVELQLRCARGSFDTSKALKALSEADASEDVVRQDWILDPQRNTDNMKRALERQAEWTLRLLARVCMRRKH